MSIFHVGSSADPKIMKNHYTSSKNHGISSKNFKSIEKAYILIENCVPQNARYLAVFTAKASAKASDKSSIRMVRKSYILSYFLDELPRVCRFFQYRILTQKTWKIIQNRRKIMKFHRKIVEKWVILIENSVPQNARYVCIFTAKASAKASEINFP